MFSVGVGMKHKITHVPVILWVLLGFLASYLIFFIKPCFLNSTHQLQLISSLPKSQMIGYDLWQIVKFSESWFVEHQIEGASYAPITWLMFSSMLRLDHSISYAILTGMTLLAYLFITALFPIIISKDRQISPAVVLMLVTGLYSYGFYFELERGQWNVVAVSICFLSIYIYHFHSKIRYIAYLLFSLSIQLKIYPAIFIITFVKDPRDWTGNLKRFVMIGLLNVALLFVLGWRAAIGWLNHLTEEMSEPYIWWGNHSIKGFSSFALSPNTVHSLLFEGGFLLLFLLCFSVIIVLMWKNRSSGLNPYLLLVCSIGALIVPSASHDYKLSILAGPMAVFFNSVEIETDGIVTWLLQALTMTVISFFYGVTLFSYRKPEYLLNNFPYLMIILAMLMLFILSTHRTGHKQITLRKNP